ncbi:unnamed protein product, partial [Timema podura]|nr:unnamed protein product [Timema podura]
MEDFNFVFDLMLLRRVFHQCGILPKTLQSSSVNYEVVKNHPLLLIVSYDGFRHNYFEKQVTPTLQKLKTLGTHAEYMRNVFETKTFPNHHSIATGLFPEVHGVLANSLYDPIYKRVLNFSYELWHQNENIIPIWNYNTSISWEERVDTAIGWFLHPVTPANLVMLYIEEPDASSHIFGPESQQVLKQLAKLDRLTDYLQHRLVDNNLSDVVNVFHLSDHGMDTVTLDRIVNLTDYVDRSTYITSGSSPVLGLVPLNKGELLVWTIAPHTKYNEEHIYKSLKNASLHDNFRVFKRADIPERWHFKNNNRTPPILAVADEGYAFDDLFVYQDYYIHNYNVT